MKKEIITEQTTTIRIYISTKDKLKVLGNTGESYNDVLLKLIDNYKKKK